MLQRAEPSSAMPMKNGVVPVQPFPTAFPNIAACSAADLVRSNSCPGFPTAAMTTLAANTAETAPSAHADFRMVEINLEVLDRGRFSSASGQLSQADRACLRG